MQMQSSVTVLISSGDHYCDSWPIMCYSLNKYWQDCPWDIAWITNYFEPSCGYAFKVGIDKDWTHTMRLGLKGVNTPIILFLMTDTWLYAPVDTAALIDFARIVLHRDADYIRVSPNVKERGEVYPFDPRLYIVPPNAEYRAALQAAFWWTEALAGLLHDGESAWTFEIEASKRARGDNMRYLSVSDFLYFRYPRGSDPRWNDEPIRRGAWTDTARRYLREEGLDIDLGPCPRDRKC